MHPDIFSQQNEGAILLELNTFEKKNGTNSTHVLRDRLLEKSVHVVVVFFFFLAVAQNGLEKKTFVSKCTTKTDQRRTRSLTKKVPFSAQEPQHSDKLSLMVFIHPYTPFASPLLWPSHPPAALSCRLLVCCILMIPLSCSNLQ